MGATETTGTNMTAQIESELEALLPWSKAKEVNTKNGPRFLRKATPTEAFWNAWRVSKERLKAVGISCGRTIDGADWEVLWWRRLPPTLVAQREEAVEQSRATDAEINVPCPEGLAYMPFQRAGIRFAMQRTGTLIGDEMGLGKTIQALGFINGHSEFQKVLIITKASLKMNWFREATKWLVNKKLTIGIAGNGVFPSTDVVIINYDICAKFQHALWEREWDVTIIDECHQIKNRKAKRTKAIVGYKPGRNEPVELASTGIPSKNRLALTGTPIENNLEEMWTVLWWLNRDDFPSRWKLLSLAGCKSAPGMQTGPTDIGLERLQEFLRRTVMIRRLKKDVLTELPAKTRIVTEFDSEGMGHLIDQEREIWDQCEADRIEAQAEVEVARASDDPEAYKAAVAKLRETQSIAFTEMARVRRETAEAKVPKTIAHIRERLDEVGTMIVFAHHTACLESFAQAFGNLSVLVHGGTSLPERDARVNRFMTDPSCRLFFGSIRATGEGLNLTAANYVLFHEFDWVPSKMVQCEDRAHRIGQNDNVTVEVCVVDGTIDARMAKVCVAKADLAESALDSLAAKREVEEPAPVVTDWKPLATARELKSTALLVTSEMRAAVHAGLSMLAGVCDGARKLDGAGFNKLDSAIGKKLALTPVQFLSDRQIVLGAKLVNKYRRQLPEDIVTEATKVFGDKKGSE